MARNGIEILTWANVKNAKPGLHSDGANLYLRVSKGKNGNLRKSWIFRYELAGNKPRDMGLGSFDTYSLDDVRELARGYRKLLREGVDPIEQRERDRTKTATEAAAMKPKPTFDKYAADYIKAHERKWTNRTHAKQWRSTLAMFASPVIGSMPVDTISTAHLIKVLQPIWYTRTVTAARVRQRIESVLDFAKVSGDRDGENPARWRGHLDKLLPAKSELKTVTQHPALPYVEIGAFMEKLRQRESMTRLALEFCILTAARTGEVIGASWQEIDLNAKTWVIPKARMKARRDHRVPLSDAAVIVLRKLQAMTQCQPDIVFYNDIYARRFSINALHGLLRSLGRGLTT
ncbi:MAG TPA: integrase arm-type DNA-binding domain-containing protein, partial [Pseudolabrys sp.]